MEPERQSESYDQRADYEDQSLPGRQRVRQDSAQRSEEDEEDKKLEPKRPQVGALQTVEHLFVASRPRRRKHHDEGDAGACRRREEEGADPVAIAPKRLIRRRDQRAGISSQEEPRHAADDLEGSANDVAVKNVGKPSLWAKRADQGEQTAQAK